MNFGDFVFATSPETGMFYGIYLEKGRCWRNCAGVQELTNKNIIKCTSINLAKGGFGGNWFEQRAEKIEVGSKVWCSDFDYETAIDKPHMECVVVGKGARGYRTVALEDVEKYNSYRQVTIFHWKFAVPTGKKVIIADLSVKKKEKEPALFKIGDRVLCVKGNRDVNKGETYEVLEDVKKDSKFVNVLTPEGGQDYSTSLFKKVKSEVAPEWYEPKFQPGDLVECVEGNIDVNKGWFCEIVKSYPHKGTGTRFVTIKRPDGTECNVYERRFVLVPKGDGWSFEITNGVQVDGHEIAENLTKKKPIIYHTGIAEDKAFFEIHNSFIFKWQQLEDLWDEAHEYLTFVRDHETYRTYVTDLSNIDILLHIFRAVKKLPWPADGSGRRKVEVFQPTL